jgi:hypothetical protein
MSVIQINEKNYEEHASGSMLLEFGAGITDGSQMDDRHPYKT